MFTYVHTYTYTDMYTRHLPHILAYTYSCSFCSLEICVCLFSPITAATRLLRITFSPIAAKRQQPLLSIHFLPQQILPCTLHLRDQYYVPFLLPPPHLIVPTNQSPLSAPTCSTVIDIVTVIVIAIVIAKSNQCVPI